MDSYVKGKIKQYSIHLNFSGRETPTPLNIFYWLMLPSPAKGVLREFANLGIHFFQTCHSVISDMVLSKLGFPEKGTEIT